MEILLVIIVTNIIARVSYIIARAPCIVLLSNNTITYYSLAKVGLNWHVYSHEKKRNH